MTMTLPPCSIASLVLRRDHSDAGDSHRVAPLDPNWPGMHLSRSAVEWVQRGLNEGPS